MKLKQQILKEIFVLVALGVASFLIAGYFDALEAFVAFSEDHEDWELDEILISSFVIMLALVFLLINRTSELKNEILRRKLYEREIEQLAATDPLTKLLNRRKFIPMVEESIIEGSEQNRIDAVLFVDVDDFKKINDDYGHAVGDELLIEISKILSESVRQTDVVSRFAGDEFAIYLSGIRNREEAKVVAKKILNNVTSSHFTGATLSIGIAIATEDFATVDKLILAADKAMYMAKKGGKNSYYFVN